MTNTSKGSVVLRGLRVWQARKRQAITIFPVEEVRRAFAALPDEKAVTAWLFGISHAFIASRGFGMIITSWKGCPHAVATPFLRLAPLKLCLIRAKNQVNQ